MSTFFSWQTADMLEAHSLLSSSFIHYPVLAYSLLASVWSNDSCLWKRKTSSNKSLHRFCEKKWSWYGTFFIYRWRSCCVFIREMVVIYHWKHRTNINGKKKISHIHFCLRKQFTKTCIMFQQIIHLKLSWNVHEKQNTWLLLVMCFIESSKNRQALHLT